MAGEIDFWDSPAAGPQGEGPDFAGNPWELVFLGGSPIPGRSMVHGLPQLKIDFKPKAGADSATITSMGYLPGPIEIEVLLWTRSQWDLFVALVPQLWRKPNKKTKVGELAIAIAHPGCDLWGISQVIVQGVSLPEPGEVPQSKLVKIKLLEFVGKGATATKTAKPAPQFPALDERHPLSNAPEKPSDNIPGP